jgi:hypothetical protein
MFKKVGNRVSRTEECHFHANTNEAFNSGNWKNSPLIGSAGAVGEGYRRYYKAVPPKK